MVDPRPPAESGTSQDGRTLVFGDDRSPHADRAWLWINNQRWPGWSVDVLTASSPSSRWTGDEPVEIESWEPDSPRSAGGSSQIDSVRHLRSAADARLALDACSDANLLVVGPRGSSGIQAAYLGSTVDHIVRHAPAPVLVATTPNPATRIMVCTDGSAVAEHAVETLAALPLTADAEHLAVTGVASVGIYDPRPQIDEAVERSVQKLADFEPEALRVHTDGDVVSAIYAQVLERRTQLLVLGTRGLTGLKRIALGSVANALVRVAPCSVLVVPPEAKD